MRFIFTASALCAVVSTFAEESLLFEADDRRCFIELAG